jgi:hypothetical protein
MSSVDSSTSLSQEDGKGILKSIDSNCIVQQFVVFPNTINGLLRSKSEARSRVQRYRAKLWRWRSMDYQLLFWYSVRTPTIINLLTDCHVDKVLTTINHVEKHYVGSVVLSR